jgi:DNA-binding NtrC family response regulator
LRATCASSLVELGVDAAQSFTKYPGEHLDIRLPGLGGFDLQAELAKANIHIPVIFLTGHGDIPMTVKAMKAGAIDFLTKPFREQEMLDAVTGALERDRKRRAEDQSNSEVRAVEFARQKEELSSLAPKYYFPSSPPLALSSVFTSGYISNETRA